MGKEIKTVEEVKEENEEVKEEKKKPSSYVGNKYKVLVQCQLDRKILHIENDLIFYKDEIIDVKVLVHTYVNNRRHIYLGFLGEATNKKVIKYWFKKNKVITHHKFFIFPSEIDLLISDGILEEIQ